METIQLIDVSHHQGVIDWEQVKASGIAGAIIRCGYGMDLTEQDDAQWRRNADECTRLGIPFGVYLYSYADTAEKAESEARHALRLAAGYRLSYPIFYDMEKEGTENGASERARIFCNRIRTAGYMAGVYANKHWWEQVLYDVTDCSRWVARYHDVLEMENVDIWQYTSKGSIPGISGNVDLNYCYRDFSAGSGDGAGQGEQETGGKEVLAVDGRWGPAMTRRLQQIFGTTVDGKVSHQYLVYRKQNPGLSDAAWEWEKDPSGSSLLISAMQRHLNAVIGAGLRVDGHVGPKTIRALQRWMGTTQDGYFSQVSVCIRKMQEWANGQGDELF